MNEGKRWEQNFKDSLGISCIRLYDTTNGFARVRNICDFIYYRYPYQFLFELKSVKQNSLYINSDNIKRQIYDLNKYNKIDGILGGLCIQYRDTKKAFFVPAIICKEFLEIRNKKSISQKDCEEHAFIREIPLEYKRTNCQIKRQAFNSMLSSLMYDLRWGSGLCVYN